MREQLLSVQQQTGITPKELDVPQCPTSMVYILNWFYELSSGRQNGMGLNPISWQDIRAWQEVTGERLALWELNAIKRLDSVFIETFTPPIENQG